MRIPFADLRSAIAETEPIWRAHIDELHTRSSYILGRQLEAFEAEFAAAMGARFAVGVGSGTDALGLCLRELGITDRRQEVLTSALTAPFTAVAIASSGATPVFADVDPEDLHLDPVDLGNRIGRRTTALIPVHLYGQRAKIEQIARVAKAAKLPLVQDACQAHGSDRYTRFSPHVAYSFYPTKNLGALGDAGAIVTDNARVARRLREMRDGGRRGGQVCYGPGINSRLDELQACYLRAFLTRLPAWNERRRRLAALYDERLAGVEAVRPIRRSPDSVCHLYIVRAHRRDRLREHLLNLGIATGVHYPVPLHLQPAFAAAKQKRGDLPQAEKACREIVSLPIHPFLMESQAEIVAESIRRFYS